MDTANTDRKNKLKSFFTSKSYSWILWVVAELILLAIVFALGINVGLHKAKYSYEWGANYERNFMGRERGQIGFGEPGGMPPKELGNPMDFFGDHGGDFRNAHGLSGSIVSITDNKIVIKDQGNKENTVAVSDKTMIKSGKDDIKIGDLKTDEKIVVMGKPNDSGVIDAELIRVFADSANSNTSMNNPPVANPPVNSNNSANGPVNNSANPANTNN